VALAGVGNPFQLQPGNNALADDFRIEIGNVSYVRWIDGGE
jgi:hypothetical protein